jgi:hypothetical protein
MRARRLLATSLLLERLSARQAGQQRLLRGQGFFDDSAQITPFFVLIRVRTGCSGADSLTGERDPRT